MSLVVVTGCMFSGKTEELVRRLRRERYAGRKVQAFKPFSDDRYNATSLASHVGSTFEAIPVKDVADLRQQVGSMDLDVIGFDEAQFMSDEIISFLDDFVNQGGRVIVAGLDMDYRGQPFGPMPTLLAIADKALKLHAICVATRPDGKTCGGEASRSYRHPTEDSGAQVQVGAAEAYEARCRRCWGEGAKSQAH